MTPDEFEAALKKRLMPLVGRAITPVLTDEVVDIVLAVAARDNRQFPVWFSPSPEPTRDDSSNETG